LILPPHRCRRQNSDPGGHFLLEQIAVAGYPL
jgi:hypothetical protein